MPLTVPVAGIALCADPACTAPQVRLTPERGSEPPAQDRRHLRDDLAEREDDVAGQVRAGRVTARPGDGHGHLVAGGRDGPDARADLPDVDLGVAVERVDLRDAVQPARGDHVERSPGLHLLGGLEHQPHAGAELVGEPARAPARRRAPPRCARRDRRRA